MALIKHSIARDFARSAIVLDLGDLQRQAELITQRARDQAEAIVAGAHAERAKIIAGAAAEGRAEGQTRGHGEGLTLGREQGRLDAVAERRAELAKVEAAWLSALDQFESQRDEIIVAAQNDTLKLAMAVAQRVTRRVVELHPEVIVNQLAEALAAIARPTQVLVRVHPVDAAIVREAMPGLAAKLAAARNVEVVEDPTLPRGSCIAAIRSAQAGGEVDASIETQLDRIVQALLPGHTAVPPLSSTAPASA